MMIRLPTMQYNCLVLLFNYYLIILDEFGTFLKIHTYTTANMVYKSSVHVNVTILVLTFIIENSMRSCHFRVGHFLHFRNTYTAEHRVDLIHFG